jgi:hypothetical protein
MTWLTWRQFRVSALAVLLAIAAFAVVLAVTGPQLADLYRDAPEDFFSRLGLDGPKQAVFSIGTALVYAVPAVIGVFWGAPLVARELEAGTHRLVWTQSVTRTRWLGTKLVLIGLAAVAAGLLAVALTWWCGPIDDAIRAGRSDASTLLGVPRLSPVLFGARGTLPIGLALLGLAIGVTASLLLKRSIVAMAATLVAIVGIQVALPLLVQPHLLDPHVAKATFSVDTLDGLMAGGEPGSGQNKIQEIRVELDEPGAWELSQTTVDPSGKVIEEFPAWTSDCGGGPPPEPGSASGPGPGPGGMEKCLDRLNTEGYRQQMTYLPASDFWKLQLLETGIVLVLAAGLTGFCFWRIRRDF